MRRNVRFAALVVLLWVVALATGASAQISVSAPSQFSFVAYGDIRFTNPANTHVSNPAARQAIVERISQLKPSFVLVAGDLVLAGKNRRDWAVWDAETKPWRTAAIPVFPVPGNHEEVGDPQLVNYLAHFPELDGRRWYSVRAGNVLCLMLDSDADAYGGEEWQWLEQQLALVPPEVDFLVLVMHHPPYTHAGHGPTGGHSGRPSEARLAAMLEQRQASIHARMLVIAGHIHNYERYEHQGIMYVVSGGGGATPYEVSRSADDFYREPGPTYHFLRLQVHGRTLSVEMNKLELTGGKASWTVKDSFDLEAALQAKVAHAR